MPEENREREKNLILFYNQVVLDDNKNMVVTDNVKPVFLNYDAFHYISTRVEHFIITVMTICKSL